MAYQGTMKLVDANTGLMRCRVCGAEHHGRIVPGSGGKLYKKNYTCPNGCKASDSPRATSGQQAGKSTD